MSGKNNKGKQPQQKQEQPKAKSNSIEMKDGTIIELLSFDPKKIALDAADKNPSSPKDAIIYEIKEDINKQRKDTLKKAFEDYDNIVNTLKSIKPDKEDYHMDGKPVGPIYSKEAYNKKKQALDKFENLKNAINEAWAGDFTNLEKLYKVKY